MRATNIYLGLVALASVALIAAGSSWGFSVAAVGFGFYIFHATASARLRAELKRAREVNKINSEAIQKISRISESLAEKLQKKQNERDYAESRERRAEIKADLSKKHGLLFPPIICFCGSTRFTDRMLVKQWELTKRGVIVLSWCALPDWYFKGPHVGDAEGVKEAVDWLHERKIDLADAVHVLNYEGYIGESTRSEIAYAEKIGKPVTYER